MPKIKNIIIFTVIGAIFISIYILFIKKPPSDTPALISAVTFPVVDATIAENQDSVVAQEFLTVLLGVKNIKLDDTIFSSSAFTSLRDSSIILTPDGSEGRPNPFSPLGIDNIAPPAVTPTPEPEPENNQSSAGMSTDSSSIEDDLDDIQSLLDALEAPAVP